MAKYLQKRYLVFLFTLDKSISKSLYPLFKICILKVWQRWGFLRRPDRTFASQRYRQVSLWMTLFPLLLVSEGSKPLPSFGPFAYFSGCIQPFWPYPYYWKPNKPIGTNHSLDWGTAVAFWILCLMSGADWAMKCIAKRTFPLGKEGSTFIYFLKPPLISLGRLKDFCPVAIGPLSLFYN